MRCLGLDPSLSNFGWALHDSDAVGPSRCTARGRFQTSNKSLFIDRYCDLRHTLGEQIKSVGVTRVGIEYPVFHSDYSEGMYGLFLYSCEALRAAQVDVVFFSPGQVKAHAAAFLQRPKGWKMMKPDMVEAAKADTGGHGKWNHNEADAYWIARTASRFWMLLDGVLKEADLTPAELKQFTEIKTFTRGRRAGETIECGIRYREDERFFRWSQEDPNGQGEKEDRGSPSPGTPAS